MATPPTSVLGSPTPSTTNACRTPGSALISSRFALATLPPKTGHFSKTADSMPGSVKSIANTGWPVTIFRLSTPGTFVPMIV